MSSPGECLYDAGVPLEKVSPKAAQDYAEIFDGVPSKHDGKDAAIVAELASLGKSSRWKYEPPSEEDAQIAYQVDWIDAQQRQKTMWLGRLEGLLARHWPELTGQLKLSSPTLLQLLCHYGGPSAVAEDAEAAARLRGWGGLFLTGEKIDRVLRSAAQTFGVRQGRIERIRMQHYASQAYQAHQAYRDGKKNLECLVSQHEVIQRQAEACGVVTAYVLWAYLGDPSEYHCAQAYRKARCFSSSRCVEVELNYTDQPCTSRGFNKRAVVFGESGYGSLLLSPERRDADTLHFPPQRTSPEAMTY